MFIRARRGLNARPFLDTSALAKHYHTEAGTADVDLMWADQGNFLYISRIGVVEAVSVFAGKVRKGVLPSSAFLGLRKRFLYDIGQGRPHLVRILVKHFKEADRLIQVHGLARQIRTLDSLQLAVALDLRSRGMVDMLVSSDRQLLAVAEAEGMAIFDPENP